MTNFDGMTERWQEFLTEWWTKQYCLLPLQFYGGHKNFHFLQRLVGWFVVLRINVDLAIFQPYLDLEAGDNQSLKIQVARPGIEPRSSCFASQELNHSATAFSAEKRANNTTTWTYLVRITIKTLRTRNGFWYLCCYLLLLWHLIHQIPHSIHIPTRTRTLRNK